MKKIDQVQVLFPCEGCAPSHRVKLLINDESESELETKLPFEINEKSTFMISPAAMELLEDTFGKELTERILTVEILHNECSHCENEETTSCKTKKTK